MYAGLTDKEGAPFISVVVPVYNGSATIERSLSSLKDQDYPEGRREIVVVDDGSRDGTAAIARRYTDKVITHAANLGLSRARVTGMKTAAGKIIVNIDADIIVYPDALSRIVSYFLEHPDVAALTGRLSREHPHRDFFSQYKNLYMYYTFGLLPERVSFLYGSIHAFRDEVASLYRPRIDIGEDTLFGQQIVSAGKKIAFLRDLEVVHLKRYGPASFIKNDFLVPFNWARIFVRYGGWRQIGRASSGFSHAPKGQLVSIATVGAMLLVAPLLVIWPWAPALLTTLVFIWVALNMKFMRFLMRERGGLFTLLAFFVTLFDNSIMGFGIVVGFLSSVIKERKG